MTRLQSVQRPSSQPQGAGQCFISPVMLSHLTAPATWKVAEVEEKHRDNLRLTKDTSVESPSEQLCATDAKINRSVLTH